MKTKVSQIPAIFTAENDADKAHRDTEHTNIYCQM